VPARAEHCVSCFGSHVVFAAEEQFIEEKALLIQTIQPLEPSPKAREQADEYIRKRRADASERSSDSPVVGGAGGPV
jgi:hypothetical protein